MAQRIFLVGLAIFGLSLAAMPAEAIVRHPDDSPNAGDIPPRDVIGSWGNNNASAVAVSRTHVVTTQHQDKANPQQSRQVTIDNTNYTASDIVLPNNDADIRVARITKNGNPASLDNWLEPYEGSINTSVGNPTLVTIGGVGDGRGAAVTGGYEWDENPGTLRFGRNALTNALANQVFDTDFTNDQLLATFESDSLGLPGEATIADGDSGGGFMVNDGGEWKLLGLTQSVQNTGEAIYNPSETMFAVDIRSHAEFINNAVPEPSSAMLLGGAGFAFAFAGRRRRRTK